MIFIVILLLFALWVYLSNKKTMYVPDETFIGNIVRNIRSRQPELVPLETISVDNGIARMMWFDTRNYSGQILDSTASGVIPRAPPLNQFSPIDEESYMPYDEIQNFHKQF